MIPDALRKIAAGRNLTRAEATAVVNALMDGQATPAQMGALLTALHIKGETVEEITGFALGMRARMTAVRPRRFPLLDTCGMGGSRIRVFNVSTAAAFAAAATGIAVAKHGNRAMTGTCGSADVLEALGIRVGLTPEQSADCIDEIGIGFLFAPSHHPAMKQVSGPRREIGIRTIFNLVGPITNPAGASRQVMGVPHPDFCPLVAGALRELGSERVIIVHGEIGMGEISTLGPTQVSELLHGQIVNYTLTPHDLIPDAPEPDLDDLAPALTADANADRVREALAGTADTPAALARRNLVAVNAAASLRVSGMAETWPEAVRMAQNVLESGSALQVVERLAAFTQHFV